MDTIDFSFSTTHYALKPHQVVHIVVPSTYEPGSGFRILTTYKTMKEVFSILKMVKCLYLDAYTIPVFLCITSSFLDEERSLEEQVEILSEYPISIREREEGDTFDQEEENSDFYEEYESSDEESDEESDE